MLCTAGVSGIEWQDGLIPGMGFRFFLVCAHGPSHTNIVPQCFMLSPVSVLSWFKNSESHVDRIKQCFAESTLAMEYFKLVEANDQVNK